MINLGERYTELHCSTLPTSLKVQNISKIKIKKIKTTVEVNRLGLNTAGRNILQD